MNDSQDSKKDPFEFPPLPIQPKLGEEQGEGKGEEQGKEQGEEQGEDMRSHDTAV